MTLTSFTFICFLLITGVCYYVLPGSFQWCILLVSSIFFYTSAGGWAHLEFLIYGILITYFGAWILEKYLNHRYHKWLTIGFTLLTLLPLFLLKYIRFFGFNAPFGTLAPLGISFYTMTILGYLLDVSRGVVPAQKNLFKHALFASFFPQMVSGPITRYTDMEEQLFSRHKFNYIQVTYGVQRILWGFFKKLVISERLATVVNQIYDQYPAFPGWYLIVGTVCFAFQLYTDFSGCMDIVIGVSQALGISLPENFTCPFFSRNISEYWRKWHITLGTWFKDYVFYPLLKSNLWISFTDFSKKRFGKKKGKKLPLYSGMLVLWFAVGMWHGGSWNYIIGSGLLHWFYIVSGELLSPYFRTWTSKLHIDTETFSWKFLQTIRTFVLVNIGFIFFRSPSIKTALSIGKSIMTTFNPEILFDRSLFQLLVPQDWVVTAFSLLLVMVVSILQEYKIRIRETLAKQNLVFRWFLYLMLFAVVLIFGCYGGDYDSAAFIYQQF